ncbi:hypothetical protein KBY96_11995 [Cyanobium sp. ATX 6A2]|uniref:hypothetical protein n=1 Tax=Cyanobium sp. ATX 6A2 TaxID=2823700 RepID=UPI0020CC5B59|nr:hypothetical protein [Cyanobium sp. ATX 6A2]MCP9888643.1 hypothetical protein [Cyanobium sp. ATX 6A2]
MNDFSIKRVLVGVWLGFPLVVVAASAIHTLIISKAIKPTLVQAVEQHASVTQSATLAATP